MNVYIYRAALYCKECAERARDSVRHTCKRHRNDAQHAWDDSEHWPHGPYADGGGEADSPQHCDTCHVFLENPLASMLGKEKDQG